MRTENALNVKKISLLLKNNMLKAISFLPHPPIIIPTIGSFSDLKKVEKTIKSLQKLASIYAKENIETVILVSPHAPLNQDSFVFNNSEIFFGHFFAFGDFETELVFKNDKELLQSIIEKLKEKKIPFELVRLKELDHGTLVPLFYLSQKTTFKILPFAYSFLDRYTHFQLGKVIQEIVINSKKNIGFVASGDLSHCLTFDAPAGFSPKGEIFDKTIIELIKNKDSNSILELDPNLVEESAQCGYHSLLILLGILDGIEWEPEILSYEAPFGVGYLVANFKIKKPQN